MATLVAKWRKVISNISDIVSTIVSNFIATHFDEKSANYLRKKNRNALFERQVMRVVPTPPDTQPIKMRSGIGVECLINLL